MKKPSALQLSPLALIPCLLSFAAPAVAGITCAPTASPTHVKPGGLITLRGNCTDTTTNLPVSEGNEVWRSGAADSSQSIGQRTLPNGTLTVIAPTIPGEHSYVIESVDTAYGGPISVGGEGGFPSVTVTVDTDGASGPTTLDQLSRPLTTLQTARVNSHLKEAQSHLRLLRAGGSLPQFDAPGVPLPDGKKEDASRRKLGFYLGGLGDYLRQDGSPQSEFKVRTTTLSLGADYRLNDDWVMGGNLGYSHSHVDFDNSASDQKSNGTHATAYASWSLTPAAYLSASLSYEASKFDLQRDAGNGQVTFASPRGHGVGVSLTAGRDFLVGAWSIGPYARWDNVTSDIDAFNETGAPTAVSVSSQRTRSNTLNVGAQTQVSVPTSWGIVLPYVRLELSHRNDSHSRNPGATLLSDNTSLLIPAAVDARDNFANAAAGISGVNQGGISWFFDYETGLAQQGYRTQRFGLGLRFEL